MVEAENHSQRLTELPMPYEGVAEEVFAEVLMNRQDFNQRFLENLKKENPHLLRGIVLGCTSSPEPDESLMWVACHYEIYARAARKEGKLMLLVTEETAASTDAFMADSVVQAMGQEDEEKIVQIFTEVQNKIAGIKGQEGSRGDELATFWALLGLSSVRKTIVFKQSPAERDAIERITHETAILLHAQEEVNRMSQTFRVAGSEEDQGF